MSEASVLIHPSSQEPYREAPVAPPADSNPVRRLGREEIHQARAERRRAQKALRKKKAVQGPLPPSQVSIPNRVSALVSVKQEQAEREEATVEQVRVFRAYLPILLARLAKIPDARNPKKVKHKATVLMLYGILTFALHRTSRREANRTLTRPSMMENLKLLFPELETIPHHDTLSRLLAGIEVDQIEEAHLELVQRFIRNKKFRRYLIANCYPIAVDGSQKLVRDVQWSEETLQREVKKGDGTILQHYVYVLEANLAFHNGMTIPLMTEFLSHTAGDTESNKQDCEQRAFRRLAERLKRAFSHLPILVLLDGLYANGPIIELCRKKGWDFMIVLQDGSLPSVWEDVKGIRKLEPGQVFERTHNGRVQKFWWVNDIRYEYGPNGRHHQTIHVVVCEETWEEVDRDSAEVITKKSRHAWISARPLSSRNVHPRCNLGARHRWSGIESSFLVEKRQGYQYEHAFSYDFQAMKGYHYLMRLAHMFNALAQHASTLVKIVTKLGVRGFIQYVAETISGPWLDPWTVRQRLAAPFQLRFC